MLHHLERRPAQTPVPEAGNHAPGQVPDRLYSTLG